MEAEFLQKLRIDIYNTIDDFSYITLVSDKLSNSDKDKLHKEITATINAALSTVDQLNLVNKELRGDDLEITDNTEQNTKTKAEKEAEDMVRGIFQSRNAFGNLMFFSDEFSKRDKEILCDKIEVSLNSIEELTSDLESKFEELRREVFQND
jgi:hypothetical protein